MPRIIAGRYGGRTLRAPDGRGTRPTSDRVRESVFGTLESMDAIADARVLDLYAGSGALGLEAWSRGAASVELVERGRAAAGVITRNIAAVSRSVGGATSAPTRVHHSSVRAFLSRTSGPYDLVFTDPPYELDDAAMTDDLAALAPALAPGAIVVIERARRSTEPALAACGLELLREKSYGDTRVWWAVPTSAAGDESSQETVESQSR